MTAMGDEPSFDWALLVPRVVSPVQVAIVEALVWLEQPLSSTELTKLFAEPKKLYLGVIAYHVRKLNELDVLSVAGNRQVRGSTETFYSLSPAVNGSAQK